MPCRERYWERAMTPDTFWIPGPWRGRLAIVTRPRGSDWLDDDLKSWRQAGFDIVVSLLEAAEAAQLGLRDEPQVAQANGLGYRSFSIPDRGVPPSMQTFVSLVSEISTRLDEGKSVAIHCRQGIGRSALVAIGILAGSGLDADRAIEIVSAARGLAVPETAEQRKWITGLTVKPSAATP